MSTRIAVSQPVLSWALQRSERTFEEALTKFPKLGDWMDGSGQPTLHDLEKFAAFTHTSLGTLIMPDPPDETLPIADMRTRESTVIERPSGNLLDTIDRYQQFQDWYHDYALEQGADKLPFLGSVNVQDSPRAVARRVRSLLHLDRVSATGTQQWCHDIVAALEDVGVLVMRSGVVGANNTRRLSTREFRGFSLYDDIAPLIFVNVADEPYSAQNFTLMHEFAHLLLGHSALSGGDRALLEAVRADYGGEKRSSGGGNYYNTLTARLGRSFATAVVTSTLEGRTGFTESFRMIGTHKREVFDELARHLQVV